MPSFFVFLNKALKHIYLKQFPAFRTRFFYFSKEKNKKELKQLLQSGLGILLFCIFFDSKKIVNIMLNLFQYHINRRTTENQAAISYFYVIKLFFR
ncbi:hypothetical protein AUW17_09970 [Tenacibaculum dicentrarchi]|nr:hypothetical protein AUW17_09970 [Tenacibaculum dicentrarchi]